MNPETGFWFFQLRDVINVAVLVATIFAIIWGPIRAVQITRQNDDERMKRERRFNVFYSLMKTRRMTLHQDHVMALNTVLVDFYGCEKIEKAYKEYIKLLNRPFPAVGDPKFDSFYEDIDNARYDLLHEIGAELGYKYDKRELVQFSYTPKGWNDEQILNSRLRELLIGVLGGNAPLPVTDFEKLRRSRGIYPPAPPVNAAE